MQAKCEILNLNRNNINWYLKINIEHMAAYIAIKAHKAEICSSVMYTTFKWFQKIVDVHPIKISKSCHLYEEILIYIKLVITRFYIRPHGKYYELLAINDNVKVYDEEKLQGKLKF